MSVLRKLFDIFSSFELLFLLLVLLAVAMSVGTVLPQQSEPEEYIQFWGKVKDASEKVTPQGMMEKIEKPQIDRERGERIYNRYRSLGFLNIYHSKWFLFLCYLLCLNVFLCVIKRLVKIPLFAISLKKINLPKHEKKKFPIPLSWEEEHSITMVEVYLLLVNKLRKSGFRITKGEASLDITNPETNGKHQPPVENVTLIAWKGFPQKLISVLFHLSMIAALIACGLGSLSAFETKIMLEKGVIVDDWLNRGEFASKTLRGELVGLPPSLSMSEPKAKPIDELQKEFITPSEALEKIKSADKSFIDKVVTLHNSMLSNPFIIDHFDRLMRYPRFYKVELVDFFSEYVEYKSKPSAKDWFPKVRFLDENGNILHEWVAESNHPAKFKGIQYHISDYLYKFQLVIESPDGSMMILPSESPDGKGFPGYFARKAYGWKPEVIKLDNIGAEISVKAVYTGRLYQSERAKESTELEPYVEINIKTLDYTDSASTRVSTDNQGVTDGIVVKPAAGDDKIQKDASMNQGGMQSKPPQYVKLRTRRGYIDSREAPLSVNGYKLYLGEINPIVEFGVRHDPGIPWFYFFGYLACIAMAIKVYYPTYRLRISISSYDKEHVIIKYNLTGWGLLSCVNAIRKNITIPKDIN